MTKEQFIETFVVQFLSSHAGANYAPCICGCHNQANDDLIEAAHEMAEKTWESYDKYVKSKR